MDPSQLKRELQQLHPERRAYLASTQGTAIQLGVQFSVDEAAFEAFRERLLTVLSHIAVKSDEMLWTYQKTRSQSFETTKGGNNYSLLFNLILKVRNDDDHAFLLVNTSKDETWSRLNWKLFVLDQNLAAILQEAVARNVECTLSSSDAKGSWVPFDRFSASNGLLIATHYGNEHLYLLAGTFSEYRDYNHFHSPTPIFTRITKVSDNELKRLDKIKCELRFSEGNPQQRRR